MTGVCLYEGPVSLLSILPPLFQSVCCQSVSAFPVQHSDILKCIHFQSRHSETGDTKSFVPPLPQMFALVCSEWMSERQITKEEQNQSKNEKKGRRESRNKEEVKWDGLKWVDQRGRLKISMRLMRLMAFFYPYFSVSPGLPAEEEVKLLVGHGS